MRTWAVGRQLISSLWHYHHLRCLARWPLYSFSYCLSLLFNLQPLCFLWREILSFHLMFHLGLEEGYGTHGTSVQMQKLWQDTLKLQLLNAREGAFIVKNVCTTIAWAVGLPIQPEDVEERGRKSWCGVDGNKLRCCFCTLVSWNDIKEAGRSKRMKWSCHCWLGTWLCMIIIWWFRTGLLWSYLQQSRSMLLDVS